MILTSRDPACHLVNDFVSQVAIALTINMAYSDYQEFRRPVFNDEQHVLQIMIGRSGHRSTISHIHNALKMMGVARSKRDLTRMIRQSPHLFQLDGQTVSESSGVLGETFKALVDILWKTKLNQNNAKMVYACGGWRLFYKIDWLFSQLQQWPIRLGVRDVPSLMQLLISNNEAFVVFDNSVYLQDYLHRLKPATVPFLAQEIATSIVYSDTAEFLFQLLSVCSKNFAKDPRGLLSILKMFPRAFSVIGDRVIFIGGGLELPQLAMHHREVEVWREDPSASDSDSESETETNDNEETNDDDGNNMDEYYATLPIDPCPDGAVLDLDTEPQHFPPKPVNESTQPGQKPGNDVQKEEKNPNSYPIYDLDELAAYFDAQEK